MKKKNAAALFLSIILILVLPACSNNKTKTTATALEQIDMLRSYNIVKNEPMPACAEQAKMYPTEDPKAFKADKFIVAFNNGDKIRYVVLQTEEKVGHSFDVVPGETVVDGYIELIDKDFSYKDFVKSNSKKDLEKSGYKLSKSEQEYFIKMLYSKLADKTYKIYSQRINEVKDYALAIYFNGSKGVEELHRQLSKEVQALAPLELKKMSIYLYKEKSTKTQPEQIMTIDIKGPINAWENMFEDKGKDKLPAKAVKGIFLYEKELGKDQVVEKKYITLVKLEDGSGYYKEFPALEKYDIENYSKQKGEELINKVGRDNWSRNTYEGSDHDVWLDQQLK